MALVLKLQLLLVAMIAFWADLPLEQKGIGVAAAAMVLMDKTMTSNGTNGKLVAMAFVTMLVWVYAVTLIMNVTF